MEAECWNCNPETVSSVPVVDPGEGPTLPPIFLDQTKAQKAKKFFSETAPPLPQGLDDCPPPPHYLKVWICHWIPNQTASWGQDLFSIVQSSTPWSPLSIANRFSSGKMFVSILIYGPQ